ncbi:MAG: Lrp/AsnC family transcriptional regulator [Rhodospirillales bacterium]|nr:Lrp/AsnC family transcriptional regulator [Rhodospirillales bacterium]
MDAIDLRILAELQQNAQVSMAQLAEKVGLSTTPCWRRVQSLEKSGVIRQRVTLLDRDQLNVGVDVFVSIRTRRHNVDWLKDFAQSTAQFPEVVEFYRMSGEVDYLLRVVVPDIAAYDAFYKRLIEHEDINDISSSFAMETIKYTTALPLNYV